MRTLNIFNSRVTRYSLLVFSIAFASSLMNQATTTAFASEVLDVQVLWDAEDEPLNIGDVIHFEVTTDGPGSVVVDISTVHQSIQLYDNGANGDAIAGDNVYELDYAIFEGDTVEKGPILVHFVADDGTEIQTNPGDEITPHITIDGTRPVVTNDGVSPDPFNPYIQVAYIRYILTENAAVSITIYRDDIVSSLVRRLGTPSGRPGENHTTWDGADDEGNTMPDGRYTYEITAKDNAGNDAISSRGGCILSTVYIEIDNSLIAPSPFSPDGDSVDDITWVTFDIELAATEEQLAVLGFGGENFITASTEDDGLLFPYAVIGITVFDSSGESKTVFSHDLTPQADTDFAPNGWPNGKMPQDVPLGSGNFLGLPNSLPDFADGVKANDWDNLVPLHGPFNDSGSPIAGCPYYKAGFSVGWDAKDTPDGTYLISIECELTGRTWEFTDYMKGEAGILLGEKWRAVPARHHGVTAFPRRKSVIIDRKEVITVDDDPPIVTSTTPSGGSAIDPTRERTKDITATLDDGAGGSGVDPIESTLALLDPLDNKLGGQLVPLGINTVKLVLDSELTISGEYTIEITPVDKRGNKAPEPVVRQFIVEDKSAPTVVPGTIRPEPNVTAEEGEAPAVPYTEPITEISAVITDGLTGSGVDLDNSTIYLKRAVAQTSLPMEETETIEGTLITDEENRKLTNKLKEPLAVSGTYTIVVIATDKAGAKGIYTYQFVLDMAENIAIRYEGKVYLMIYASTTALSGKAPDLESPTRSLLENIAVQEPEDFPPIVSELSPLTGSAIEFAPYDIELSQDADLTLYYSDDDLPLGIQEEELAVYAFRSQAGNWVQLSNAVLSEEDSNNKLTAKITYIDEYYIIAYTSPMEPSLVEDVLLLPSNKYFNPDREPLTFIFAKNMTDYRIEVYNVAGDRIVELKEQGRADNSLAWDGKNEDNQDVRNGVFICKISYKMDGRSISPKPKLIAVIR